MLLRSLGRELIVSVDRITMPLRKGDELILCSDGLYGVFESHELDRDDARVPQPMRARKLIRMRQQRGTARQPDGGGFQADSPKGLTVATTGGMAGSIRNCSGDEAG